MSNTIYATFADVEQAEKAAGALLDHGVRNEDLSIVHRRGYEHGDTVVDRSDPSVGDRVKEATAHVTAGGHQALASGANLVGSEDVAARHRAEAQLDRENAEAYGASQGDHDRHSNHEGHQERDPEDVAKHGITTTTPADAGAGAIKGTAIGAGIGAVAALASLLVPGVGLVVGGGALAAALGGFAATAGAGAAAGAVTGYLMDQGVDHESAQSYDRVLSGGGALLSVSLPSGDVSESEAREILSKYGAANVNAYGTRGYVS